MRTLSSVLKCLVLVEELARSPRPLGVSELARAVGAERGTVHVQLRTLVEAGWVEQVPSSQYRLSLHSLEIAAAALEQADLGARLAPLLTDLAARSQETAGLAVLDGGQALMVHRVESTLPLKADIKVGTRLDLATSASGRVLVAFTDDARRRHLATIPDANLPPEALQVTARRQGYAMQQDELDYGMASVAVPIRARTPGGLVALSLATPSFRFDLARSLEALRATAAEMQQLIGGGP